eukprot:11737848-Alexandrium_andersonii.AAC.1
MGPQGPEWDRAPAGPRTGDLAHAEAEAPWSRPRCSTPARSRGGSRKAARRAGHRPPALHGETRADRGGGGPSRAHPHGPKASGG